MPNEKANIEQNIITPPEGDREKEKRLLEALKAIPDEEIIRLWEERDEEERRREEEEKKREIPQELKDFREKWKERIGLIDENVKKTIIEITKEIPVKVETYSDWSRLIEFKLWDKTRKILEPKLEEYSEGFRAHLDEWYYDSINRIYDYNYVTLNWMRWDVADWENEKLRNYVNIKKDEWFYIATKKQIKEILTALWKKAQLDEEKDQIAMFMYLTWMDWWYWLKDITTASSGSHDRFYCNNVAHYFYGGHADDNFASLFFIACEWDEEEVTPKVDSDPEQEMIDFFSSVNGNPKYHY